MLGKVATVPAGDRVKKEAGTGHWSMEMGTDSKPWLERTFANHGAKIPLAPPTLELSHWNVVIKTKERPRVGARETAKCIKSAGCRSRKT